MQAGQIICFRPRLTHVEGHSRCICREVLAVRRPDQRKTLHTDMEPGCGYLALYGSIGVSLVLFPGSAAKYYTGMCYLLPVTSQVICLDKGCYQQAACRLWQTSSSLLRQASDPCDYDKTWCHPVVHPREVVLANTGCVEPPPQDAFSHTLQHPQCSIDERNCSLEDRVPTPPDD